MLRVVIDFIWLSLVISIVLGLLASVIPALGQSGAAVSTIVSALVAGQLHGRRTGMEASKGFAWKAAAVIAVVTLVLSVIVVSWLRRSGAMPELDDISMTASLIGLAMVGLLTLLVVRFAFRAGTKLGAKNAQGPSA